ncbi:MAG: DUF1015 family protein [Ginsengibacter sp.]
MAIIIPFKALRPEVQYAKQVASPPYDVLSSKEAKILAQGNPASFLHITKSEIDLPEDIDIHSDKVYAKAKENLDAFIQRNILFTETKECFYIYQLIMDNVEQTGLVCCSSVDDYENDIIKKHEFTRPEKEMDRINHMKAINAQTGNVFLAYKNVEEVDSIINSWKTGRSPIYDFLADDKIQHSIWLINDEKIIGKIKTLFEKNVECTYIADGHHRAASAAKVRESIDGSKIAANYFLTTLFPSNQLRILDYNRVVKDLNGFSEEDFLKALEKDFNISKSNEPLKPSKVGIFGMYINEHWYKLQLKDHENNDEDPVSVLDISKLDSKILKPLLGITDQRTNKRIDFIGGIRGLDALEKRVDSGEMAVAFTIFPVTINQLFAVADSGNVMPPKSTWFEPKLRDGLLTHLI